MRGFRAVGSTRAQIHTDPHCSRIPKGQTPLVQQIIDELSHGSTTRMVAVKHGLPQDFVDLILERAEKTGALDFFELKPSNCTQGTCTPDPESLVCSGCPIMPAAVRRQQSLVGKLLHRSAASH